MNRVRELRQAAGLTLQQLADIIGTTRTHMSRLERDVTRLDIEWMSKISAALKVHPADLIDVVALAANQDDVSAVEPSGPAAVIDALRSKGISVYTVVSDAVSNLGIALGDTITVDTSAEAVANAPTGSVVLARINDKLVLRQFVRPDVLMTNGVGPIVAVKSSNLNFEIAVIGLVLSK